jgi:hypothetical protein
MFVLGFYGRFCKMARLVSGGRERTPRWQEHTNVRGQFQDESLVIDHHCRVFALGNGGGKEVHDDDVF